MRAVLCHEGKILVPANENLPVFELLRRSVARLTDWERSDRTVSDCTQHELPIVALEVT